MVLFIGRIIETPTIEIDTLELSRYYLIMNKTSCADLDDEL